MAIGIHVAYVEFKAVDALGNVLDKESTTTPLSNFLTGSSEHRVKEDSGNTNTTGSPTVRAYLELEAADDYVLEYMDQTTIVTYLRNSTGGFPAP